jgi:hypothetical protein
VQIGYAGLDHATPWMRGKPPFTSRACSGSECAVAIASAHWQAINPRRLVSPNTDRLIYCSSVCGSRATILATMVVPGTAPPEPAAFCFVTLILVASTVMPQLASAALATLIAS